LIIQALIKKKKKSKSTELNFGPEHKQGCALSRIWERCTHAHYESLCRIHTHCSACFSYYALPG